MEIEEVKFKNIQRLAEIIVLIMVVSGVFIVNLPLPYQPNKKAIYITALLITLFIFVWHRIPWPKKRVKDKNFIEALIDLAAIAAVVHFSGGVMSYFNFLFLLPNLNIAMTSNKTYSFLTWLFTAFLIFGEVLFFAQPEIVPFAGLNSTEVYAFLNAWGVGLVSAYGRYIAKESGSAEEAATAAAVEKERSINKLKDEFIFIISHELRGPITAIRGYLELFVNTAIPPEVKTIALSAFKQSEKLNNLIAQLLDLSRIETGKFKLSNERFDFNLFAKEVLAAVNEESGNSQVKINFIPGSTQLLVYADKERVREVLTNLVENALKFSKKGGEVNVSTKIEGNQVYISVADNGVGIPEPEINHLFERFYSPGESFIPDKANHTGLGLYLTKSLVEKMGGRISVQSQLNKGSVFTFSLPLASDSA